MGSIRFGSYPRGSSSSASFGGLRASLGSSFPGSGNGSSSLVVVMVVLVVVEVKAVVVVEEEEAEAVKVGGLVGGGGGGDLRCAQHVHEIVLDETVEFR